MAAKRLGNWAARVLATVLGLLSACLAAATPCWCGALGYSRADAKGEKEPGVDEKFAKIGDGLHCVGRHDTHG